MTDQPTGWESAVAAPAETPKPVVDELTQAPPLAEPAPLQEPAPLVETPAPEPEPVPPAPVDNRQQWVCVTSTGERTLFKTDEDEKAIICPIFGSDAHMAGELVHCPHCGGISVAKLRDWQAGRSARGLPI